MNEDNLIELNYRKPMPLMVDVGTRVATLWADEVKIGVVIRNYRDWTGKERVKVQYDEPESFIITVDYYLNEWMYNIKTGKIKII